MKVMLINPICQPSLWENEIVSREPFLGIAYIAAVLERTGHQVAILERKRIIDTRKRTEENLALLDEETRRRIRAFRPEVVGITATTPLIMDAYRTAGLVKDVNRDIPVMIGGPHPTVEPEATLEECVEIDLVCIGEGEGTFLDFVEGKPWPTIPGIAYRDDGGITRTNLRAFWPKLDELPFPARHLLDREYYFSPQGMTIRGFYQRTTTLLAARGCPFKCTFCASGHLADANQGRYVRFHSPGYVIEQIKQLIRDFQVQGILFAEDMFSVKKDNVYAICEGILRENLHRKIRWAANLRVDAAAPEILAIMKKANCVQVVYGCESGSDRTLERLHKKTNLETNRRALKATKGAGLTCEANIMIGLPGEKEEDFLATIRFLRETRPDRINRGKFCPLPGTALYEELTTQGRVQKTGNWNDLWDTYVLTDFTFAEIDRKRFKRLQAKMDRETTYRRNYMYTVKNNWRVYPALALRQFLLMLVHCGILYLPSAVQRYARGVAEALRIQSRFVAE